MFPFLAALFDTLFYTVCYREGNIFTVSAANHPKICIARTLAAFSVNSVTTPGGTRDSVGNNMINRSSRDRSLLSSILWSSGFHRYTADERGSTVERIGGGGSVGVYEEREGSRVDRMLEINQTAKMLIDR